MAVTVTGGGVDGTGVLNVVGSSKGSDDGRGVAGAFADVGGVVNIPGNPRVFISYPYLYPLKPPPALRGKGYCLDG